MIHCNLLTMGNLFYNKNNNESGAIFNSWSFSKINYIFFGLGVALIIIGYVIMSLGETYSFQSLTFAPILLFIGYIILIPLALLYKENKKK